MNKIVAVALWLLFCAYVFFRDLPSFYVTLILPPTFYYLFAKAIATKNELLKYFFAFCLMGHGLGAPFFYLNRKNYGYSGFAAVKDFDFNLFIFFKYYAVFFIILYVLIVLTTKLDGVNDHFRYTRVTNGDSLRLNKRSGMYLIVLILLFLFPLNYILYTNGVAIQGVEGEKLPYHLTGIIYYSRMFFVPLLIFSLYQKSNKNIVLDIVILAYALFTGLSSASRMVFLLTAFPVVFSKLENVNRVKSLVIIFGVFTGIQVVSLSREITYFIGGTSLANLFVGSLELLMADDSDGLVTVFGYIMNRFYGAQDIVLASQYLVPSTFSSALSYFLSGGDMSSVVPNLNEDFFGVTFSDETSGFGLGLGTLTVVYMIVRSNVLASILVLPLLALMLSLGNRFMRKNVGLFKAKYVEGLGPFLYIIAAFNLYSSTIKFFYIQMILILAASFIIRKVGRKNVLKVVE